MASIKETLLLKQIQIPQMGPPAGNYLPAVINGNTVQTSGALCMVDGKLAYVGHLGKELSVDQGYQAARICGLNVLSMIEAVIGDLDRIEQFLLVQGFVNAVDGFADSPLVINGASDLFVELFGDRGRHARAAVGVNALPRCAAVEVMASVRIRL
jgi:enamine deaminase RidA (YjgF/YER057c/UK114 family)